MWLPLFDLVRCDVWVLIMKNLFVDPLILTLVNDYSRAVWVYVLLDKAGVRTYFA